MNSNYIGLNAEQVKQGFQQFGYNELPTAKAKNVFSIAIEVIKEPMFLLLISCATVYMLIGNYNEGALLLGSVFVIIYISFYQHRKTEKSLQALRQLSSPRALVERDGKRFRIPGREVLPNDILLLNEGDRVPADAIVLESSHLSVDESLLTGESMPVNKSTQPESNLLFSGTLLVQGFAIARVTHTGLNSVFGKLGQSLEAIEQTPTKLQKEMTLLIRNLFLIGGIVSIVVVFFFYYTRGNILRSVLNGLSAAMAILPEEFPVVLTVFLARGVWRLSKKNVLTRMPAAIETLGSATVLCSDKTGTITQNKMSVKCLYVQTTVFENVDFVLHANEIAELMNALYLASMPNPIDPMEIAIHSSYSTLGYAQSSHKLLKTYPLSKQLFAMSSLIQTIQGDKIAYAKGAPEAIFKLCKLDADEVSQLQLQIKSFADKGYRVLAAAKAYFYGQDIPEQQSQFDFEWIGLVAFEDPIRPEVPKAIEDCKSAGIKVIMITGDYPQTATSIAHQIGLEDANNCLTGDDLKQMSVIELQQSIQHVRVFARIVPEQKLLIINALKANGEIVAMTGDGVNDAPALKAADIGVSMGLKGTDVAREASALVLLDDDFASIVAAIRSGRSIFDNLQKAMSYIIAIHIPIIGLVLLPAIFSSIPILLLPMHIVFMELIIDPVCSVVFESESEEIGIMQRPPRLNNERFFGWNRIATSLLKGFSLLMLICVVYWISSERDMNEATVRAMVFSTFVFGNMFLILNTLSKTRSWWSVLKERNRAVVIIFTLAFVLLFMTLKVPFLQSIFSFEFPGYINLLKVFLLAFGMLLILELLKKMQVRHKYINSK